MPAPGSDEQTTALIAAAATARSAGTPTDRRIEAGDLVIARSPLLSRIPSFFFCSLCRTLIFWQAKATAATGEVRTCCIRGCAAKRAFAPAQVRLRPSTYHRLYRSRSTSSSCLRFLTYVVNVVRLSSPYPSALKRALIRPLPWIGFGGVAPLT